MINKCIVIGIICFCLTGCAATLSGTYYSAIKNEVSNKPLEVYLMPYQCCVYQDAFWGPCQQLPCEDADIETFKGYFEKAKGYRDVIAVCAGQSDAKKSFSPKRAADEFIKHKAAENNNAGARFVLVVHFMRRYCGFDNYGGVNPALGVLPICGKGMSDKLKALGASQLAIGYELYDKEKNDVVSSRQIKRELRKVSWGQTDRRRVQEEIWLPEKVYTSSAWEFAESEQEFITRTLGKLFDDFPGG